MSRMVRRSAALATGLVAVVLAFGPTQASTPRGGYGPACAGSAASVADARLACRPVRTARRRVRTYRPMMADAMPSLIGPDPYAVGRYMSLLILGVGF